MRYVLIINGEFIAKGTHEDVDQAIEDYIKEYGEADDVCILGEEEYTREMKRMKALGMR